MSNQKIVFRYLQAFLFVAIYISLGFVLKLSPNAYLLLGIPLMLAFQIFVRKQPIYRMWVRDAETFRLNKLGWVLGLALSIFPCYAIYKILIAHKFDWIIITFNLATIVGAFAAAFSFTQFTKKTFKELCLCLVVAGTIGVVIMLSVAYAVSINSHKPLSFNYVRALQSLLMYVPVCFMLEEVVFRGVIDAHVHEPNKKLGIASALFVSVLWGLWHLPVVPHNSNVDSYWPIQIVSLIVVHSLTGIPLSIFWRRSGNLAVPAFTHAFIDAVRNAVMKTF